jgi:hypothetical protein
VRDPHTGERIVAEVWTREDAFGGPYQDLGPDLTVVQADGGLISILRSEVPVKARPEPVGTHRPLGIFFARGQGVRAGVCLPELSILDVAPMVLYCQDLPVPADMTGRVPVDVFTPAVLEQRAPRAIGAAPAGVAEVASPAVVYDAESEAIMMERLRALGYVE